jgi:MoaA/NifB/PqqE/SkfB family radical SAM enzyme
MTVKIQSDLKNIEKQSTWNYTYRLNDSLRVFFLDALRITIKNPLQAYHFFKTVRWQQKAAKVRDFWKQKGIHVPPIIIFSITERCNLKCKGCYAQTLHQIPESELSEKELREIITQAHELGTSFFVLAGGEPLVRRETLEITDRFPSILFLVFTNGMLLDEKTLNKIKQQKNVVPVISLEGYEKETDNRRGQGVFQQLKKTIERLKGKGIFWAISLTVTSANFQTVTNEMFIKDMTRSGCKLFFYIEYSPVKEGTKDLVITHEQRDSLAGLMESYRKRYPSLFVSIPGDEEQFGGCLSAGKGFIHISADGNIEPCPFVPYSDTNLRESTLKEALQSDFLKTIRESHVELHETQGGCALWMEKEWIQSILQKQQ